MLDLTDYDETMGRAKIVEYLYNEYSLEEILYKLAKVSWDIIRWRERERES